MKDMAKEIDVSISMVSYNTRDILDACLESIFRYSGELRIKVIVVDNASSDGSATMVKKKYPQVTLIANRENRYFARANNQAINISSARYVLILNSDVKLWQNTLQECVAFMDAHPEAVAVTCRIEGTDGRADHSCWKRLSPFDILKSRWPVTRFFPGLKHVRHYSFNEHSDKPFYEVDVAIDAFLMVRRKALNQIGGYDERFLLYCTEDDICLRMKEKGGKIYSYAGTSVSHRLNASTSKLPSIRKQAIIKHDTVAYFQKYHSWFGALLVNIAMSLELILRRIAWHLMTKNKG